MGDFEFKVGDIVDVNKDISEQRRNGKKPSGKEALLTCSEGATVIDRERNKNGVEFYTIRLSDNEVEPQK